MDKVQKIREEVEKLKLCTMDEHMKFYSESAEAEYYALCKVEEIIDSLQEEPTGNIWHNPNEKPCYDKPFAIVSDGGELTATFTYFSNEVVRGGLDWKEFNKRYHTAKWCYIEDLYNNEESVSDELEEASRNYADNEEYGDDVYFAIKAAFKVGAKWQKQQDSIPSKDLAELIDILSKRYPEVSFAKLSRIAVRVAKWQKEQDQSTIELAEDHAMLAGMNKMEQQMLAKAIDATCFGFQGAALFSFRLPADNYLVGSEVKVIVIKK